MARLAHAPLKPLALPLLGLLCAMCVGHGQAAAQSSYTLSTLKPTATGASMFPSCINERDEVFGNADYYKRTVFSFSPPGFVKLYDEYASKWAATAAATVSPTKADTKAGEAQYGPRCGSLHNGTRLVDVATGKVTNVPAAMNWGPANDAGTLLLTLGTGDNSLYWTPSKGVQTVTAPGYTLVMASVLNNVGDMAGLVAASSSGTSIGASEAALWLGAGQFQRVSPRFGDAPSVVAINDARQLLLSTTVQVPIGQDTLRVSKLAVWEQGVLKPLLAPGDARYAKQGVINNKGTVVASVGQEPLPGVYAAPDMRAVIWQNGVLSDLTAYVNARGAPLPAGTVVESVLAMNDKGSMLAVLRTENLQRSVVRFTAKP